MKSPENEKSRYKRLNSVCLGYLLLLLLFIIIMIQWDVNQQLWVLTTSIYMGNVNRCLTGQFVSNPIFKQSHLAKRS